MSRQSKSSRKANEEWIKAQINLIQTKLEKAEKSGFTNDSKESILTQSKSMLDGNEMQ
jgi:hypothetical protein